MTLASTDPRYHSPDDFALAFFGSEFASPRYIDWPIERRLEAYLRHADQRRLADAGETFDQLLDQVMRNFARARRDGLLAPYSR